MSKRNFSVFHNLKAKLFGLGIFLAIFSVSLFVFVLNPPQAKAANATGSISGTVRSDDGSSTPLPGITVTLSQGNNNAGNTVTSQSGTFTFNNLSYDPGGTIYTLYALSQDGRWFPSDFGNIIVNLNSSSSTVNFIMHYDGGGSAQPESFIATGSVADTGGTPVANATVTFYESLGNLGASGQTYQTTSDSTGSFTIVLPIKEFSVIASKNGYQNSQGITVSSTSIFPLYLRLTPVAPKAWLWGYVQSSPGSYISGVTVTWTKDGISLPNYTQTTSTYGQYGYQGLDAGAYTLTFTHPSYQTKTINVNLQGVNNYQDIILSPNPQTNTYTVSGTIKNISTNETIANIGLSAKFNCGSSVNTAVVRTNEQGIYTAVLSTDTTCSSAQINISNDPIYQDYQSPAQTLTNNQTTINASITPLPIGRLIASFFEKIGTQTNPVAVSGSIIIDPGSLNERTVTFFATSWIGIANLTPTTHTFKVSVPGYQELVETFVISTGVNTYHDFTLAKVTTTPQGKIHIYGGVADSTNNAIHLSDVVFTLQGDPSTIANSNEYGYFDIYLDPTASNVFSINLTKIGYVTKTIVVSAPKGQTEVDLRWVMMTPVPANPRITLISPEDNSADIAQKPTFKWSVNTSLIKSFNISLDNKVIKENYSPNTISENTYSYFAERDIALGQHEWTISSADSFLFADTTNVFFVGARPEVTLLDPSQGAWLNDQSYVEDGNSFMKFRWKVDSTVPIDIDITKFKITLNGETFDTVKYPIQKDPSANIYFIKIDYQQYIKSNFIKSEIDNQFRNTWRVQILGINNTIVASSSEGIFHFFSIIPISPYGATDDTTPEFIWKAYPSGLPNQVIRVYKEGESTPTFTKPVFSQSFDNDGIYYQFKTEFTNPFPEGTYMWEACIHPSKDKYQCSDGMMFEIKQKHQYFLHIIDSKTKEPISGVKIYSEKTGVLFATTDNSGNAMLQLNNQADWIIRFINIVKIGYDSLKQLGIYYNQESITIELDKISKEIDNSISGKIFSKEGIPLPFVKLILEQTEQGNPSFKKQYKTLTDNNGKYFFSNSNFTEEYEYTLIVSYGIDIQEFKFYFNKAKDESIHHDFKIKHDLTKLTKVFIYFTGSNVVTGTAKMCKQNNSSCIDNLIYTDLTDKGILLQGGKYFIEFNYSDGQKIKHNFIVRGDSNEQIVLIKNNINLNKCVLKPQTLIKKFYVCNKTWTDQKYDLVYILLDKKLKNLSQKYNVDIHNITVLIFDDMNYAGMYLAGEDSKKCPRGDELVVFNFFDVLRELSNFKLNKLVIAHEFGHLKDWRGQTKCENISEKDNKYTEMYSKAKKNEKEVEDLIDVYNANMRLGWRVNLPEFFAYTFETTEEFPNEYLKKATQYQKQLGDLPLKMMNFVQSTEPYTGK